MGNSDHTDVHKILANVVDYSDDAIVTKTLEGIITSWNRGAEKIFGYTAEEAIGKHISILIPPARLHEEPQIIEKIKNGEIIDHYETERLRKDGTILQISLTISATRDPDGNIIGILKIARDITFRKKAEEVQARMAGIINLSDDAIITKTLEGMITSWNRGAEKIFGYKKHEVIGKHVSILIPPGRHDEEPRIIEKVSRGELIDHYETERLRKDGSLVHISLSVSPIQDREGNISGILKIARDVSLRNLTEQIKTRLASIINFSDDAIISKTLEGIITSWNAGAQKIFGYTAKEAIGKHISILIPSGRLDEEPEIIRKVGSGEHIEHYVTERLRKGGGVVNISLTVSPIKDEHGNVVGVSKIARDITKQIMREEEIKNLNQELQAFNYTVAHDLRAPLRSISSFIDVFLSKYGPALNEDARHIISRIIRKTQRMDVLIRDLLTLSQLGKQEIQKSLIDTNAIVQEVADEIRAQHSDRKIDVRIGDLPPAYADVSLLKQVWENLIGNAVKYSRKQNVSLIEIASRTDGDLITYFVRDNGEGFDMKYADKLFTAFQRLHNQEDYEGTGVGLAIVHQIVAKHGGKTWAEGKTNAGATFYFSLPA